MKLFVKSGVGYPITDYAENYIAWLDGHRYIDGTTCSNLLPEAKSTHIQPHYIKLGKSQPEYLTRRPQLYRIQIYCHYEPLSPEENERAWNEYIEKKEET